jgi:phosphoglucomutase
MSTPAVSSLVRKLNKDHGDGYCFGGIILSASHNPGGPDDDFGIKFNTSNGSPSLENITDEIFEQTNKIQEYSLLEGYSPIDTSTIGEYVLPNVEGSELEHKVSVIDGTEYYTEMMAELFDFEKIKQLMAR